MKDHAYCTYFDSSYLSRGKVLIETLRKQEDWGALFVLALDQETLNEVSHWSDLNVEVISQAELEKAYPELIEVQEDRSAMEYVFTLTPWLTLWTLEQVGADSWATYLDADLAFFSSTEPIYEASKDASVTIVEHRFTWEQAWRRRYGRFNVAWVGFRNSSDGRACLNWWAESCLKWCFDRVEGGRFADQRYLDSFPQFPNVVVVNHPGVDAAPWNLRRHQVEVGPTGSLTIDRQPLIFFHFHGLRSEGRRYFFKHLPYLARTTTAVRERLYRPYCEALWQIEHGMNSRRAPLSRKRTVLGHLRLPLDAFLSWIAVKRGDYLDVSGWKLML